MSIVTHEAKSEMVCKITSELIEIRDDEGAIVKEKNRLVEFREKIIRCRDCKHFIADHEYYGNICFWKDDGGYDFFDVNPNGFCAWAEKMDE